MYSYDESAHDAKEKSAKSECRDQGMSPFVGSLSGTSEKSQNPSRKSAESVCQNKEAKVCENNGGKLRKMLLGSNGSQISF